MNIRKISRKREIKGAKEIGGKCHAGSGNKWHSKSDFSNEFIQVEDKFTEESIYSLKLSELKKLEKEALSVGKLPVFRFGYIIKNNEYNFAILRKKDCIYNDTFIYKLNTRYKSITLYWGVMYHLYTESKSKIFLELSIQGNEYSISHWSALPFIISKILSGEKIT